MRGETMPVANRGPMAQNDGQKEETRLNPETNSRDYSSASSSGSTSMQPPAYSYQELPGGVVCPTCSGAGKIPRGQEDDLVALIPYRDDRLRPRRTGLYVFLSILFCGAVAGILCAFLLTKPVNMSIESITTTGIFLNASEPKMIMNLRINYNISNSNFPSIYPQNITVIGTQGFSLQPVISNMSSINITVGGRSKSHFNVNVTAVFVDEYVTKYCSSSTSRVITIQFSSSLQYHLMTQSSSISSLEYKQVECTQNTDPFGLGRVRREQSAEQLAGGGLPAD